MAALWAVHNCAGVGFAGEGMQAPEGAPAAPEDAEISDTDSDDNVRSAADRTALAGLQVPSLP